MCIRDRDKEYTLIEKRAPETYAEAENIVFKLVQVGNEQEMCIRDRRLPDCGERPEPAFYPN